jgi:pimeloyl-ACP methyl ester carboxylesterase/AraC-like DNA-binding protein
MPNIKVRYVRSENKSIAYTSFGQSENTLIMINGWVTNIEENVNLPGMNPWLDDISTFSRVILFDKRGVGLSDRVNENNLPNLQERIDDLKAIMDQENLEKVTLWGASCGGPMALMFAYLYPERVKSVILYGSFAKWVRDENYIIGIPLETHQKTLDWIQSHWGEPIGIELLAPSLKGSHIFRDALSAYFRKSASPGAALALYRMNIQIDVTPILPEINVPVLVLHRKLDKAIPLELGKFIADRIPGAALKVLDGEDHLPFVGDTTSVTRAIAQFMGTDYHSVTELLEDSKLNEYDLHILNTIKSHLDHHFLDDVTIDGLSFQFGINTFKLKHGFKKLFGVPVISYVREKRLKYSAKLLQKTELSVKEIAYKTGYRVPGSFSKAFQLRFDKTPTDIRKLRQGIFH